MILQQADCAVSFPVRNNATHFPSNLGQSTYFLQAQLAVVPGGRSTQPGAAALNVAARESILPPDT